MKISYPIILTPDDSGYVVFVPDFNINTEGNTFAEAIEMARDAIGLIGTDMENSGCPLPTPSKPESVIQTARNDIVTSVTVDLALFRRVQKSRQEHD